MSHHYVVAGSLLPYVFARLTQSAEAISTELIRLPRTFQVLAMTTSLCRCGERDDEAISVGQ
jgi:hypothetical protein